MDRRKYQDIDKFLGSFESQLEIFAQTTLSTKVNDDDNVFAEVQIVIERVFIKTAMKLANENVSKAAKLLGMSRNTLMRKLKSTVLT
jgi:DNA-binding protein Fis